MSKELLYDILKLIVVDVIVAIMVAVAQTNEIPLLTTLGNAIMVMAVQRFGYKIGKRESRKNEEDRQEMTNDEAINVIFNERLCVMRADKCDRNCAKCDLVKPDKVIIEAYDMAIAALSKNDKK